MKTFIEINIALVFFCVLLFFHQNTVSAQTQVDLEETGISNNGPFPNDEFRALATAQLDAIAFMCNQYLVNYGEYPKDLYELQASEFWVASIDNLFTGQPIQQIEFIPADKDFMRDPIGAAVPRQNSFAPSSPRLPQAEQGGESGTQGNSQGNTQQNNTFSFVSVIPPRLDASRIGALEPGNVLYYPLSDSALQLIMWMNSDVYVDYFQTSPMENDVIRYKLVKELNPTDRSVLATAILLEEIIPRNYSYWQFYTGQDPLLPIDIPTIGWDQRKKMYDALHIRPMNVLFNVEIEPAKEFKVGMVADTGNNCIPPVYCLYGNRLRTLRELTDPRYLSEHKEEIINRERAFFGK